MSFSCPKCGSSHDTEKGMKIHYGRSHEGDITGHEVQCDVCDDAFSKTPALIRRDENHYCSKKCRLKGQTVTDEELIGRIHDLRDELGHTPRRDDIRGETGICLGVITNHFGSWNNALKASGYAINEHWKVDDEDREIRYYGPNWKEQRQKARKRDNYQCVRCGLSNNRCKEKNGRALPVHHITWDESKSYKERNRLENLATLCHSCHAIIEHWPVSIQYKP